MEISWKWLNAYLGLLLIGFCKGFPLNLEDTNTGQAQFLTGIAAILITVGSIVLAGCLCCQRRKGFEEFHNSPVVASTAPNLEHGHVNPIANGEFTIFTPLSPPNFNNNVFLANEQIIRRTTDDYVYGDIDVRRWFDGPERDFPRNRLKYIRELGQCRFGKVVEGAAQDLDPNRTWTPVVVRILDAAASTRERVSFLNDASFYLAPHHPNLLALKGRCLSAAPLLLLQESCGGGDLKARLKTVGSEDKGLQWCCQLASALRHLHENGFIHPDLAARNCLLTDSLTLKLGDYSLSTTKYPGDYYKGGEPLIPVRWRSPESLHCTPTTIQPKPLTREANVWSLGVVMWEICENGAQPYGDLDDDEVISRVYGPEGLRLDGPSKPQIYSDYIFRLVKMCWNNAESRPKVAQIDMMLSDLLQVHKNTQTPLPNATDDFDRRWESLKPNTIVRTDNHNITIDIDGDHDQNISKPMSPSLNNLHGSLDNLSSGDHKGLSDTIVHLGNIVTNTEKSIKPNLDFELGPTSLSKNEKFPDSPNQNDSLTDSMIFKQGSSESDTEEENWRRKVERGAYTEKVRLKSRSVADLMVLTHVDYSESESETPMPSIDYRSNRSFRKSNLENSSLNFSSAGNLLSIEDTFEKELKKLQVERRDSLLFVPDHKSENSSNLSLLHELNSPTEIKPINQIYNIFNMTIDKFGPLRDSASKLNDIINISDENRAFSRQDSENKSDLGYATLHNSERNSDFGSVDGEHLLEDKNTLIELRLKNCELIPKAEGIVDPKNSSLQLEIVTNNFQPSKQNLPDILTSLDHDHGQVNVDLLESNLLRGAIDNEEETETASICSDIETDKNVSTSTEQEIATCSEAGSESPKNNVIVPKLSDLVLNNHKLKHFVPSEVENVIHDESQIVPDLCSENVDSSDSASPCLDSIEHSNENSIICEESVLNRLEAEVYTENLLPEIKQNFIKGPNILEFEPSTRTSLPSISRNKFADITHENQIRLELMAFLNAERNAALEDADLNINEAIPDNDVEAREEKLPVITSPDNIPTETESTEAKVVTFDLSKSQEKIMPNSLTHTAVFTSTPFGKKKDLSLPTENAYSSLNLFGAQPDDGDPDVLSPSFAALELENDDDKLNYSLETWDNFLGKSFDCNRESNENLFDSFTSEPRSMLFFCDENGENKECTNGTFIKDKPSTNDQSENHGAAHKDTFVKDGTFVLEEKNDGTFVVEDKKDGTFLIEKSDEQNSDENAPGDHWEQGGGWFLHPQSSNEKLSGDIEAQPSTSKGSYIGFGVDDEIMTAIRNELLEKLPHAQGASHENIKEEEEWNQAGRNEVFLRYNVYNTPLSPIPEESSFDENDEELVITGENTPKLNDTDSDWSDRCELDNHPPLSSHTNDRVPDQGHTPSQSSCCSNDTLFNFEDFASINEKENNTALEQAEAELSDDVFEKNNDVTHIEFTDDSDNKTLKNSEAAESEMLHVLPDAETNVEDASSSTMQPLSLDSANTSSPDHLILDDFLTNERNHTSSSACSSLSFGPKVVAPLPSPEDNPWKSLPASLLTYDAIQRPALTVDNIEVHQNGLKTLKNAPFELIFPGEEIADNHVSSSSCAKDAIKDDKLGLNLIETSSLDTNNGEIKPPVYENLENRDESVLPTYENLVEYTNLPAEIKDGDINNATYENIDPPKDNDEASPQLTEYDNIPASEDAIIVNFYENDPSNDADYVNMTNFDVKNDKGINEYTNSIIMDEPIRGDHDVFGVLTDIRFSGPIDNQLMSTSFSESNEVDEQDWDSGSDTRSSSSGEFIWKEGEHEESLKALRAAPHDVLEDLKPMEEITEETTESDVSTSSSDEEGENLEFVPSAWDKFATPTKSALRSPEKSLDRSESKKSKGVWFKKQKYHCVYEYPREPESPVLQSQDLWKPQIDYAAFSDWEFDAECYLPSPTAESDLNPSTFTFRPKINNSRRSLYYLTSLNDLPGDGSSTSSSSIDKAEYLVPKSSRSTDASASSVYSQFFPGASSWIENITPDSGLDDSTPGSTTSDSTDYPDNYLAERHRVLPLKKLAAQAINRNKEYSRGSKDVLGGLRHTRSKLKLDLPPSPSAFTSTKTFTVEPLQEPVVLREKPTFSTFGKSRFLVQQVVTPTSDDSQQANKNVCFDVLPYKPVDIIAITNQSGYQESHNVVYEPLKSEFEEMSAFSNKKEMLIKGEASLLDSTDEDSGIESSTLERKANKENILLE